MSDDPQLPDNGIHNPEAGTQDPESSPTLDELYRGLAHAHMAHEDLQGQLAEHVRELDEAEQQLQAERADTDESDSDALARIDDQLEQIQQARQTAQEHLPEDENEPDQHQEHDRHQ